MLRDSVREVASQTAKGAARVRARVSTGGVLPQPVGPMRRMLVYCGSTCERLGSGAFEVAIHRDARGLARPSHGIPRGHPCWSRSPRESRGGASPPVGPAPGCTRSERRRYLVPSRPSAALERALSRRRQWLGLAPFPSPVTVPRNETAWRSRRPTRRPPSRSPGPGPPGSRPPGRSRRLGPR